MRTLLLVAAMLVADPVQARDVVLRLSIAEALATPDAQAKLDRSFRFFFGDSRPGGAIERSVGRFTSSKKANSFGRKDEIACQRAFLSALLSFQKRVARESGDAVVKLTSFYRRRPFSSATEYECGTGALMSGVTFQGEVVKLR